MRALVPCTHMVSTLIAAEMKRRGATAHPAKSFKNVCRGVLSANWGKGTKQNSSNVCVRTWAGGSFFAPTWGGEENVYMIGLMSYNFYYRNEELIALPVHAPHHWFKAFPGCPRVVVPFH